MFGIVDEAALGAIDQVCRIGRMRTLQTFHMFCSALGRLGHPSRVGKPLFAAGIRHAGADHRLQQGRRRGAQVTSDGLSALLALKLLSAVGLEGCLGVGNLGAQHLAALPRLRDLDLGACDDLGDEVRTSPALPSVQVPPSPAPLPCRPVPSHREHVERGCVVGAGDSRGNQDGGGSASNHLLDTLNSC